MGAYRDRDRTNDGLSRLNFPRAEVLKAVTANRTKHIEAYQTAMRHYDKALKDAGEKANALLQNVSLYTAGIDDAERSQREAVSLIAAVKMPRSALRHYDRVISMLSMAEDVTVTLDQRQYEELVMDQWEWSDEFKHEVATLAQLAYRARS